MNSQERSVIKKFLRENYRHFNAAVVVEAAEAWNKHLKSGGKMLLTLAGAMSTAELGISIAELIRQGKVHAVCSTGANLEEDIFNLVAHKSYKRIPHYRDLTPQQELELRDSGFNRVTDTCIPEEEAMRKIESHMLELWQDAHKKRERYFPHEYFYRLLLSKKLEAEYEIDPKNSWLLAAAERSFPLWVPGWEDSTLGNMFVAGTIRGEYDFTVMKSGLSSRSSMARPY